jgi:hypothetical protein
LLTYLDFKPYFSLVTTVKADKQILLY